MSRRSRSRDRGRRTATDRKRSSPPSFRRAALVALLFFGVGTAVYGPALRGPFLSDDRIYLTGNRYVQELSLSGLAEVFDPLGAATEAVGNYAPVHLLLHALAWRAFGSDVLGHHLLNLAVHALAAALYAEWLVAVGIPLALAFATAALFLLHPANVEAVAWISQLKTTSSLVLALGALLAARRRPLLATVLFVAGLLGKPTAAVALPALLALDFCRLGRVRWRLGLAWGVLLVAFALAELSVHARTGVARPIHPELGVRLRSVAAFGFVYLRLALTTWGLSAFHEPEPAISWLDPRWLGGLALGAALALRCALALRARRVEAVGWLWALVSFAPVSQLTPFLYPVADRYLYFILPGLGLGAAAWLAHGWKCLGEAREGRPVSAQLAALGGALPRAVALGLGLALAVALGVRSHSRAGIWTSPALLLRDAALHYPDGVSAHLLRARRAAQAGDAARATAELREAWQRGYNRIEQIVTDPLYAPLLPQPSMRRLLREMASSWVEHLEALPHPTQGELRMLALAYRVSGQPARALRALERALEVGGPEDALVRKEIAIVRTEAAEAAAAARTAPLSGEATPPRWRALPANPPRKERP